jgi:hypothetical protein
MTSRLQPKKVVAFPAEVHVQFVDPLRSRADGHRCFTDQTLRSNRSTARPEFGESWGISPAWSRTSERRALIVTAAFGPSRWRGGRSA